MKKVLFAFILASLTLCFSAVVASAQNTAGVTGVVKDGTGAVIAGADVNLTDTKTGAELTTKTNDQGVYSFTRVAPGIGYKLTFTSAGFQTLVINDVALGVGNTETHNAEMTIGEVSGTVEVTASNEVTLNTTDASIGNVIGERRLKELPIQIRNSPAALIGLQPGVVGNNVGTTTTNRVGSVTGSRADQGNITVDGIDANDQATGQFAATVGNAPIDAIQEFRAVSTNPGASEGRSSGGQVELVTKSGSNEFHGNVREYNRTAATAANSFFNNRSGIARPQLTRNQFGGSIGGPIMKDALFFFFDYEGRRDAQGVSYLRIVPLNHFRNGGLGYINNTAGCGTGSRLNTTPNCISVLTPAQVTALDPKGVGGNSSLLSFINSRYPVANDLTAGDGINTGGFRFNAPSQRKDNTYTTRIDWNATSKQKFFGRFNIARRLQTDTVNSVAAQFPGDPETAQIVVQDYAWVVGHTWTVSPSLVNQATVGVSRSGLLFPTNFKPSFPNSFTFGMGLAAPFAGISDQDRFVLVPTIRDDVTWIKGTHTLEFGGSF
ncbi:MAG TPA: carboxypeptidase-like regulatory domain-containing protein, partial [Pyrinomonadaceae bacterium]|nr:carboxypeptidase-like regulatory domain-containing protein [Pyrinomonadaceae bacterium]